MSHSSGYLWGHRRGLSYVLLESPSPKRQQYSGVKHRLYSPAQEVVDTQGGSIRYPLSDSERKEDFSQVGK